MIVHNQEWQIVKDGIMGVAEKHREMPTLGDQPGGEEIKEYQLSWSGQKINKGIDNISRRQAGHWAIGEENRLVLVSR